MLSGSDAIVRVYTVTCRYSNTNSLSRSRFSRTYNTRISCIKSVLLSLIYDAVLSSSTNLLRLLSYLCRCQPSRNVWDSPGSGVRVRCSARKACPGKSTLYVAVCPFFLVAIDDNARCSYAQSPITNLIAKHTEFCTSRR